MASIKFEKGSREWYMFQDYWKICQKFWIPDNDEKYWESLIKETEEFYEKYKEVDLAKGIILAFCGSLEMKIRER